MTRLAFVEGGRLKFFRSSQRDLYKNFSSPTNSTHRDADDRPDQPLVLPHHRRNRGRGDQRWDDEDKDCSPEVNALQHEDAQYDEYANGDEQLHHTLESLRLNDDFTLI